MKRFLAAALAVLAIGAAGASTPPPDDRAITHVLNRTAFGPRPGDVERVRAIGIDRYIDEQLHPDRIRDDAVSGRLAGLQTPRMSRREIVDAIGFCSPSSSATPSARTFSGRFAICSAQPRRAPRCSSISTTG